MKDSSNVLLGATWCGPCKQVKTFLQLHNVAYEYVDVDTEEGQELAKSQGVRSVPVLLAGDKKYVGNEEIRPAVKRGDVV